MGINNEGGNMSRMKNNPINLCDWCSICGDRFKSIHNCMNICGAPLEILQALEHSRKSIEQTGEDVCEELQKN